MACTQRAPLTQRRGGAHRQRQPAGVFEERPPQAQHRGGGLCRLVQGEELKVVGDLLGLEQLLEGLRGRGRGRGRGRRVSENWQNKVQSNLNHPGGGWVGRWVGVAGVLGKQLLEGLWPERGSAAHHGRGERRGPRGGQGGGGGAWRGGPRGRKGGREEGESHCSHHTMRPSPPAQLTSAEKSPHPWRRSLTTRQAAPAPRRLPSQPSSAQPSAHL